MSTITPNRDEIIALRNTGLSYSEVASRLGTTRSAVAGHVRRQREYGPKRITHVIVDSEVRAALGRNGGNLSAAARELGIPRPTLHFRGYKGTSNVKTNDAKDPKTYDLIELINGSGLSDAFIVRELSMSHHTIRNWRRGSTSASAFLNQCIRDVIKKNTPGY